MKSINEILDYNVQITKEAFEKSGQLQPLLIIHSEQGAIPVVLGMDNENEKRMALTVARILMLKYRAYAYSIAIEAWAKSYKKEGEYNGKSLKGQEGTTEVLIVGYCGYDRQEMRMIPINRGIVTTLGKMEVFDGQVGGTFMELLPPAELHQTPFTKEQQGVLDQLLKMAELFGMKIQEVPIKDNEATVQD
jgi:hypothetical protein